MHLKNVHTARPDASNAVLIPVQPYAIASLTTHPSKIPNSSPPISKLKCNFWL